MDNLKIVGTDATKLQVLHISGAINSYTFSEFETKIFEAIKISDVILDMSAVTHLSSSGLGILMSANEEGEEVGHKVYIMHPSNAVKLAIDFTGFSDMFNFIHSIEEVKR